MHTNGDVAVKKMSSSRHPSKSATKVGLIPTQLSPASVSRCLAWEHSSLSQTSTDRITVILTSIPHRDVHHRSTSIENNRRFHNGQRSRCIEIYRVSACESSSARSCFLVRDGTKKGTGIKCFKVLSHRIFAAIFLPSRHCSMAPANQCASTVCSAVSFHGLIFASAFARFAFATSVS